MDGKWNGDFDTFEEAVEAHTVATSQHGSKSSSNLLLHQFHLGESTTTNHITAGRSSSDSADDDAVSGVHCTKHVRVYVSAQEGY